MKSFQYCVVIGRFQPFHHAHYELIKEALSLAETALVVIGSASKAPSIQNPWSALQREEFIKGALTEEELARVKFLSVRDYYYLNNRWLTEVQQLVYEATDGIDDSEICNLGHLDSKDDFPQWKFILMRNMDRMPHANVIRGLYFTHDVLYKNYLAPNVIKFLEEFKSTVTFKNLKEEYDYIRNYKSSWDGAPFAPTFVTVDCVVIKSGHVCTVRRKGNPGRGLIALPGGFLNQKETTLVGAIRELKEETGIKVSKEDLEKAIVEQRVFDYPERSLRGRTITHAFLIDLGSGSLPPVKGDDDADKAWWMSLSELATREADFFEDHFHIISHFVNKF
jgi:bifunctional NMN adenylyltransferase/nudix hydrolase